jgi:hypothetical protein
LFALVFNESGDGVFGKDAPCEVPGRGRAGLGSVLVEGHLLSWEVFNYLLRTFLNFSLCQTVFSGYG